MLHSLDAMSAWHNCCLRLDISVFAFIGAMQVAVLEPVLEVHTCIFPEKAHFVPNLQYHTCS